MAKLRQKKSVDEIMTEIDLASEPDVMSKTEAIEFLERIKDELGGRIEALRDEISNEKSMSQ